MPRREDRCFKLRGGGEVQREVRTRHTVLGNGGDARCLLVMMAVMMAVTMTVRKRGRGEGEGCAIATTEFSNDAYHTNIVRGYGQI